MKSITVNKQLKETNRNRESVFKAIKSNYLAYADNQSDAKIYWYMKAIIVIPCVIMVPAILAMSSMVENFEWFVGFTMLTFFSNIMIHIAQLGSKIYVPWYHASIAIMILIPSITYFFSL